MAVRAPAVVVVAGAGSLAVRAGTDAVDGAAVVAFVAEDTLPAVCLIAPFAATPGTGMLCLLLPAAEVAMDGGPKGLLGRADSLDRVGACSCLSG